MVVGVVFVIAGGTGWIDTHPLHWLSEDIQETQDHYIHLYEDDMNEAVKTTALPRYTLVREIKPKPLRVWRKVPRNARSTC